MRLLIVYCIIIFVRIRAQNFNFSYHSQAIENEINNLNSSHFFTRVLCQHGLPRDINTLLPIKYHPKSSKIVKYSQALDSPAALLFNLFLAKKPISLEIIWNLIETIYPTNDLPLKLNLILASYIYFERLGTLLGTHNFDLTMSEQEKKIIQSYVACRQSPTILNPCKSVKHAKKLVKLSLFELFHDDYECECDDYFVWDKSVKQCKLLSVCDNSNHKCGLPTSYARCHALYVPTERFASTTIEFQEKKCECNENYIGVDCRQLRNACIDSFNKSRPNGRVACGGNFAGLYGTCVPKLGTHHYKCICNHDRTDDRENDYLDCYKLLKVKCEELMCEHGYCKIISVRPRREVCICDRGWLGETCALKMNEWLEWSQWSSCEPACGLERRRQRTRHCPITSSFDVYSQNSHEYGFMPSREPNKTLHFMNHTAECYRDDFKGDVESEPCQFIPCFGESVWSQWSSWSDCSAVCGVGLSSRKRQCMHPIFSMNLDEAYDKMAIEMPCIGLVEEVISCHTNKSCHVPLVVVGVACLFSLTVSCLTIKHLISLVTYMSILFFRKPTP